MSDIKNNTASASAMLCNSVDPMLDIKRIKTEITELTFGPCDINPEGMSVEKFNFYAYARQRFRSLITTIESQNSQIESLKAITELAVKGLQEIRNGGYWNPEAYQDFADDILEQIERLQNEKP